MNNRLVSKKSHLLMYRRVLVLVIFIYTKTNQREDDMARYIRLYRSPENVPGNILGFSSGIAHGAYDKELHQWFRKAGYLTTQESKAQRQAHLALQRTADSIIHKQHKTGIQNAYRGTNRILLFSGRYTNTNRYCVVNSSTHLTRNISYRY